MTTILVYVIAAFGLTYILGHAIVTRGLREWAFNLTFTRGEYIPFSPLRPLVMLVECPACCGFHIGFWGALFIGPRFFPAGFWLTFLAALGVGCFTAGSNYLLGRLTGIIQPSTED
jgi:hypothetical protein